MVVNAEAAVTPADKLVKRNYSLVYASNVATTTSCRLADAKLVVPFLYLALGAPVIFAGLLWPVMRATELIAGLLIAPFLQDTAWAKRSVYLPALVWAASLGLIALTAERMSEIGVVVLFLGIAIVLGLCKGILNVGFNQLFGVVVSSVHRTRITFSVALISGLVTIVAMFVTKDLLASAPPLQRHIIVLWAGIVAMAASAIFIIGVQLEEDIEERGDKTRAKPETPLFGPPNDPRKNALHAFAKDAVIRKELWKGFQTAMRQSWYRRFAVTCLLCLSVLLALPFYTIHAAGFHKGTPQGLTILVVAVSAGIAAGSQCWLRLSLQSHKLVIVAGSFVTAASAALALVLDFAGLATNIWLYATVIFLVGFGASGVKNGSNLYFIEMTSKAERPCLMALNDAAMGIMAVVFASVLGVVAHLSDPTIPLIVLLVLNLLAALYSMTLHEPAAALRSHPNASKPSSKASLHAGLTQGRWTDRVPAA